MGTEWVKVLQGLNELRSEFASVTAEVRELRLAIERKEAMDQATIDRLVSTVTRSTSLQDSLLKAFAGVTQQLRDVGQQPVTSVEDYRAKVIELADQLDAKAQEIVAAVPQNTQAEGIQ